MTKEFTAVARKDGRWWVVEIPELDSVGQAAKITDIETAASEIIELMTDRTPGTYSVRVDYVLPPDIKLMWDGSKTREQKARDEQAIAARLARETVKQLVNNGYQQKEVAALLNLSVQRVSQLAHA